MRKGRNSNNGLGQAHFAKCKHIIHQADQYSPIIRMEYRKLPEGRPSHVQEKPNPQLWECLEENDNDVLFGDMWFRMRAGIIPLQISQMRDAQTITPPQYNHVNWKESVFASRLHRYTMRNCRQPIQLIVLTLEPCTWNVVTIYKGGFIMQGHMHEKVYYT